MKDRDYLCLTAILRAKEAALISKSKYDRMLSETSYADICRIVSESGYPDMSGMNVDAVNEALAQRRAAEIAEIRELIPDQTLLDLFRMQYGYHNAKVLVKSGGDTEKAKDLFSDSARYTVEQLKEAYESEVYRGPLPETYVTAIRESRRALARTDNPMLADFILDRAFFAEQLKHAENTKKPYIIDYVRYRIDKANLRSTLRTMYMGKRGELLKYALVEGGTIGVEDILNSMETKDELVRLYSSTIFSKAAEAPNMTEFEKAADNAAKDYILRGNYIAFGPEVVVEYVSALENEIMSLRIILTGKLMGVDAERLRERLRESYV